MGLGIGLGLFVNEKRDDMVKKSTINKNLNEKWNDILINYENYEINQFNMIKACTHKGIPDCYREILWQKFTNNSVYKKNPLLMKTFNTLSSDFTEDDNTIFKDIDRTFPGHNLFKDKYSDGQKSLYKVLSAYSKYNKEVGYVQGMGFICAVFLTYLDEESTFWQFHSLMKSSKYGLQELYTKGFPKLKLIYYIFLSLLRDFNYDIYEHFVLKLNKLIKLLEIFRNNAFNVLC